MGRHAAIFPGLPGGIPDPNRAHLLSPRRNQIKDALEKAGYNKERARTLAQKSNGNLSSLRRLLQNLSVMPEWAQGTEAGELSIAEVLGSWSDKFEADKAVAESLGESHMGSGSKQYRKLPCAQTIPLAIVIIHGKSPHATKDGMPSAQSYSMKT